MYKHVLTRVAVLALGFAACSSSNAVAAVTSAPGLRVSVKAKSAVAPSIDPSEANADAFIAPAPGQTVTAVVTPDGCASDACSYSVTAAGSGANASSTPPAADAPVATVAAASNVSVKVTEATRMQTTLGLANRAVNIYTIGNITDQLCSAKGGCGAWRMTLGSQAWGDYSYAWGTRSRYGKAGTKSCTKQGIGVTVSQSQCGFVNDPSYHDLYASFQANVAGLVKGFPINKDYYLHRHYWADGNSWLVTNA